jgi:hypothetical protein
MNMRINQATSPEGYRRKLSLTALALLTLLAAFLSAGCNGDSDTGGGGTTTPPKARAALGDTPIVISGGSIHLDLNNSTFQLCTDTTNPRCPAVTIAGHTMYWAAGRISSGYYYNDNNGSADTEHPINMASSEAITITIVGREGGEEGTVIIKNDRANNRVLVELDETKFKRRRAGSPRLISKKFRIEHFKVDVGGTIKDYTTEATWPSGNKVTVELLGTP